MITLKTLTQVDAMRKSNDIVAYVLRKIEKEITPGITTNYLNKMAEDLCFQRGGTPAFKGYRGFPYSICASINEEVVHGFPSETELKSGDIISIDFGTLYKGWYGDSAFTKGVGEVSEEATVLMKIGKECLEKGISEAKPYSSLGNISYAIQQHAEKNGYNVVRGFVGHGIGKNLHEEPQVPNYGEKNTGYILKPGAIIAIEPMISHGTAKTITMKDGWTTKTEDGELSVHFEHTIAITEKGTEVLTSRD